MPTEKTIFASTLPLSAVRPNSRASLMFERLT
jgi:hypothetical protein